MYFKTIFPLLLAAYSVLTVHAIVCNDKQVIESTLLNMPSGDVITMQTFNCSNTAVPPPARRHPLSLKRNVKRDAAQCTTPNCICGVPCFFNSCFPVNPGQTIHAEDCTALTNSLINNVATFTIPPNQGVGFILESCFYTAFNPSATENTEYCFNDMGVAASEVFHVCGATQQGSCEGTFNGGNFFVDQLSI